VADFLPLLGDVSTNGGFLSTNFSRIGVFSCILGRKRAEIAGFGAKHGGAIRDVGEGRVREGGAAQKKVLTGEQKYKKSRDRLELIAAFRGVRRCVSA